MRLLHTADWHLGRLLHRVPLLDAQRAVLDGLVALARAEEVDAILLAGDVFDRALPPVEAVQVAGDALRRLAEVAPVIAISGNHDSAGRLGFAAELIAAGGVHLRTEPLRAGEPVVLEDEHGPVAVYALPYLDPDLTREPLGVAERSHEAVLGAAMARVRADLARRDGHRAVVVAHAFVQGGEASESERDISVGGAQTVPASVFDGVAYAALGHLHRPHAVTGGAGAAAAPAGGREGADADPGLAAGDAGDGPARGDASPPGASAPADEAGEAAALGGLFAALAEEEPPPPPAPTPVPPAAGPRPVVRYAGSPLAYSFTEADAAKSTAIVDLGPDGVRDVRLVPVPSPFRLVRLRGELEALLDDPAHAEHETEDAWLEVTLTDARLPARPMERLRRRFPRVLVLQHAPEGELAPATVAAARVQGRSDLEVLERFVADARGAAPTDDERPLLRDAVERVARRSEED
ncbi:exonuclease SbcCD subunit D [Patulibacter sp. SYSU D01012]|uniref:exonuclease SbcCD subunit D n=1 Tax=Patulibacter sp. SYSU D01012 TaxID=2817381 RepID=UPI001B30ADFC|nr:exonuclease SbcCD subunit D [Patulibacter sp. SYSU D01012]